MNVGQDYHVESRVFKTHNDAHEAAGDLRDALEGSDWEVVSDRDGYYLVFPN